MSTMQRALALSLLVGALFVAACSPEASRTRSGGPGADPGNRGATVELHGGQRPEGGMFYKTPQVGQGAQKQR